MVAFRQHIVDLMSALKSHVVDAATFIYSVGLISADIVRTIITSSAMPPSEKVARMLRGIHESITVDDELLHRLVEVLRRLGSHLELMGNRLDSTYREFKQDN